MNNNADVTFEHVDALMLDFATHMYNACDSEHPRSFSSGVIDRCAALFNLDYNVMEIDNYKGELSPNYPSRVLIPESEHAPSCPAATLTTGPTSVQPQPQPQHQPQTIYEHTLDAVQLRKHWKDARLARCRARFPVPVIVYRGKYICRSATLSGYAEMYGRSTLESFLGDSSASAQAKKAAAEAIVAAIESEANASETDSKMMADLVEEVAKNMSYIDATRANDIRLLKYLNVSVIADLMVEMKKVKFGMNVSSSEKVDKEKRYAKFYIAVMPYPGCEFFKDYRDNAHQPQQTFYNWTDEFNNANICVGDIHHHKSFNGTLPLPPPPPPSSAAICAPSGGISALANANPNGNANNAASAASNANGLPKYIPLDIRWTDYQAWDLTTLTLNYLRSCLHNIRYSNGGMLVHCISGWDRTPLFVSLLRITLWADGVIHQSLSPLQMLYLTVAYDWYLFGHNLPDRLYKGEDIFFFCFNMLKYMHVRDLCMVTPKPSRSKHNSVSSGGAASSAGSKTDSEPVGSGPVDLNGMIFEEDEIDYNDEENRSLNLLVYPDPIAAEPKNSNSLRAKRDRTFSGRSVSSTSDQQNLDVGSMESLFADIQLNEPNNRSASPDESATTTSHAFNANNAKSSPMSVPRGPRQRNESTSSAGSWQMVTTTGSFKASESFMGSHTSGFAASSSSSSTAAAAANRDAVNPDGSSVPTIFEDDPLFDVMIQRGMRLRALREVFYQRYWGTVGRSKSHGPLGNLRP